MNQQHVKIMMLQSFHTNYTGANANYTIIQPKGDCLEHPKT